MLDPDVYPTKTVPWGHQADDLVASADLPAAALPWEPRCGKTKISIDTAAHLASVGRIDAAVVLAPNGVHLNWSRDELPLHWPLGEPDVVEWQSVKAKGVGYRKALDASLKTDRFLWVVANHEALYGPTRGATRGSELYEYLRRLARSKRSLLVVDESHRFKSPKARRTKALHKLAPLFPYRRTLTGTPAPEGPFDLWSQYHALDPEILGPRFVTFRARYGVFERVRYGHGPSFDQLVEYRNLDELQRRIAPITFPRRKADCLDLPDRVFARRRFVLSPEQRRVYDTLRDDAVARLDSGEEVSVQQAVTLLLRLQQVSRGHVTDDERQPRDLGPTFPAVDSVAELIEDHPGKAIVWCKFTRDVDLVAERLIEAYGRETVAVVVGGTPGEERGRLRARFREDPALRFWVGTAAAGGIGVDLSAASLMVFYSHGYSLAERLQALERNYGSRQEADRVDVVDLVAHETVDDRLVAALAAKEDLAARLVGPALRDLLTGKN